MSWEVWPEPRDADERAALVTAAGRAFVDENESAWWRSGLEDLTPVSGGPAPQHAWGGTGLVEP